MHSLPQAAKLLGLAESTLRHQIANRKLHAIKVSRDWFITNEEVERYRSETKKDGVIVSGVSRQRRYQVRNPDTRRAQQAVGRAIATGRLVRGLCADCGTVASQAHHANGYTREHWLDVVWLCTPCHKQRHKKGEAA